MLRSLQTQSAKGNQAPARERKDGKKKKQINQNAATTIKKPEMVIQPAQESSFKPSKPWQNTKISDEDNSETENNKENTCCQKKKKAKTYQSLSESEDSKIHDCEIKKLSKGISLNTDALNNLSTSVIRMINGIKSGQTN